MTLTRVPRCLYDLLSAPERLLAWRLLVLMLLTSVVELTGLLSILPLVTLAADPEQVRTQAWLESLYRWTGASDFQTFFLLLAGFFVLLFVASHAAHAVTSWYRLQLSFQVRHRLTVLLLGRYLAKPYVWFLRRNSAELMKAVLGDVDRLVNDFLMLLLSMLTRGLTTAAVCLGLLWLDPVLSLATLAAFTVLYGEIYRRIRRRMRELGAVHHDVNNLRFKAVAEGLASVQEGRMLFRRHHFVENYERHSWRSSLLIARYHLLNEIPHRLGQILGITSIIGALAYFTTAGRSEGAIALVGVFIMGLWRIVPELQSLFKDSSRLSFDLPVLESLYSDLTQAARFPTSLPEPEERLELRRSIELASVSFTYPDALVPAIRDLTVTIPRGSAVGLVGLTGAGKTTLADLVGGFLTPQSGEIRVDGVPLESPLRWQHNIGYVPQSVYLSDDTVRRNIALGLPDHLIDEVALVRAARLARIHDFVVGELPGGYDAVLGERGVCLSGGQRQRIGIARALYHDPELLVLDEATSSLDNWTERSVMRAIRELSGRKTMLIIAHRLSTVQNCDQLLFLDGGRLEAAGSYSELLAGSPTFRQFVQPRESA
ncbi:MAG: ABC transporter ATP-binding protein [Armatimonadetes bacterium]|nr:ABC transporter ATP-binding protein [Armatimonadota bacterium]